MYNTASFMVNLKEGFRAARTITETLVWAHKHANFDIIGGVEESKLKTKLTGIIPFTLMRDFAYKPTENESKRIFAVWANACKLITRYDDMLDTVDRKMTPSPSELRSDPISKSTLQLLLKALLENTHNDDLCEKRIRALSELNKFRREEYKMFTEFEHNDRPKTLTEVAKYKHETCGLNARVAVWICLAALDNFPENKVFEALSTFEASMMYLQVADDIHDWEKDLAENSPNYLISAANDSDELQHMINNPHKILSVAPNAIKIVNHISDQFLLKIDTRYPAIRNISKFYFDILTQNVK